MINNSKTGYPSIDKPWLKYYKKEALEAPLPEMTMYEYVWKANKDNLSKKLFRYFGTSITSGEFIANVEKAAKSFSTMGIKAGDIVTIMSMHTPETIYAVYALNYIGAVTNLVYMTLAEQEVVNTLTETNSKLLLVLDAAGEKIESVRGKIDIPIVVLSVADSMPRYLKVAYRLKNKAIKGDYNWNDFLNKGKAATVPEMNKDHEKLAVIVYTSGSTGEPKGVMLSNDDINKHASQDLNGLYGEVIPKTWLFILPPFLAYGTAHLHVAICSGTEIILQIQMDPEKVAKNIYKYSAEFFLGTPAYIDAVMHPKYRKKDLSFLKFFVGGGGECPEQKELAFNKFLKEHNSKASYSCGYGMTEAASTLCANCNEISKIGSVGIPFMKTTVKVVDLETQAELPYGKEGELHFSSPNNMMGYLHNEEATKEIMYFDKEGNSWLKSGDLGYVDEDGFVFVTGRIKRICFTRAKDGFSYKLFPQRIEELITRDKRIELCGVVTLEDEERINIPVAYISLRNKSASASEKKQLREELFERALLELPEHEQPADIIILDKMPLTMSGKVNYKQLERRI
ncbi:AMP-binding protein [Pseudobutyrivibrio xylanivorans]|uniref:Acyl--CoA ligase n=1 Tax=Pseudobutyrivibrio xylanivorans TaxID=185007 RepID=A0A5P6VR17_PSEXY|nr:class I adenylate-forming enzyme family protein [Pseudobutyrivibrio xylanivorans]QFJ54798.1 acyl--CoA ligase [Pseudobutyrivibrio xylanivorans]